MQAMDIIGRISLGWWCRSRFAYRKTLGSAPSVSTHHTRPGKNKRTKMTVTVTVFVDYNMRATQICRAEEGGLQAREKHIQCVMQRRIVG